MCFLGACREREKMAFPDEGFKNEAEKLEHRGKRGESRSVSKSGGSLGVEQL